MNVAPLVEIESVAEDPPAPLGGVIAGGLYALTEARIYTSPGGSSGPTGSYARITIQIAGNRIEVATIDGPPSYSATIAVNGSALVTTNTCPNTEVATVGYTATIESLTVIIPDAVGDDGGTRPLVYHFAKQ